MTKQEVAKKDKNLIHAHPNAILKELVDLIIQIGGAEFLNGPKYNKQRDALIACMFAYAIRAFTGREAYIQQIEDPPDFALLLPTDRTTKEIPFDYAQVENVQVPTHVDQEPNKLEFTKDLLLRTKLTNYFPAKGTLLLIHLNATSALQILPGLKVWYQQNQELFKQFGEVFIFYINSVTVDNSITYTVISLRSDWSITQNILEENKRKVINHPLLDKWGVIVK